MVTLKYREKEIIRLLMTKGELSNNTLAELLDVSDRTIRNDIAKINHAFYNDNISISSYKNGYYLDLTEEEQNQLEEILSDFESNDFGDPKNREKFLIVKLLENNEINYFSLSESLYLSENTLLTDIRKINKVFQSYDIDFRLDINGEIVTMADMPEETIRKVFASILARGIEKDFFINSYLKEMAISLKDVKDALLEMGNHLQQKDINYLLTYVLVSLIRSKNEHILCGYVNVDESVDLLKIRDIFIKHGIYLNLKEIKQVLMIIDSFNPLHLQDAETSLDDVILPTLKEIDEMFITEFQIDNILLNNLASHLDSMIKKQNLLFNLKYEINESTNHLYPFSFSVATYFVKKIKQNMVFENMNFNDSEITLITIYFELSLERAKTTTFAKAILVSDLGIAATRLIETQLISRFPYLEIIVTVSPITIMKLDLTNIDLIISTCELEHLINNFSVIKIDLPLTTENVNQINSFMESNYFWEKTIFEKVIDFDSDINQTGESLLFIENYVSSVEGKKILIKDSLLQREELHTTYIGNGLVLPHGLVNCDLKHYVYILRSEDGIEWNGKTAHYVVCILINEESRQNMNQYMRFVNNLLEYLKFKKIESNSFTDIKDELYRNTLN